MDAANVSDALIKLLSWSMTFYSNKLWTGKWNHKKDRSTMLQQNVTTQEECKQSNFIPLSAMTLIQDNVRAPMTL